jgi:hypothetical protein
MSEDEKHPKRLVLSGPMTGYPEHNQPEFNRIAKILRDGGYTVFTPSENFEGKTTLPRAKYMEIDLAAVLAGDAVVLLKGWQESVGSNAEVFAAWQSGKEVLIFHDGSEMEGLPFRLEEMDAQVARLPYSLEVKDDRSILEIAEALINGARRSAYGHPLDDYGKVAEMFTGLVRHLLKKGAHFDPEHCVMFMELVKLSREVHCPKRDNRIDGAGYWGVMEMIHEERAARVELRDIRRAMSLSTITTEDCKTEDPSCGGVKVTCGPGAVSQVS